MSPYIRPEQRAPIDHWLHGLAQFILNPGELNYAITKLCHEYLPVERVAVYRDYNEVIGVLEAAKLEFYRTVVVPYEERKRAENGAVSR